MSNITANIKKFAEESPNKAAIISKSQTLSYKEWSSLLCKTANWLHSLPVANKTAAILLPNGIPFLQLFTGASMAGWKAAPFDLKWTAEELSQRIEISNPTIVITGKEYYDQISRLHPFVLTWEDAMEEISTQSTSFHTDSENNRPFYMGFTSGTTGSPKAFIRSHKSWAASFKVNEHDFKMNEKEHVLIPGALIHSHFLYGAVSTLCTGGTVYLLDKFNAALALFYIEERPISALYTVPTMVSAILKEKRIIEKPVKIISSGAKWDEASKQEISKMFPKLSMIEFYGASELSYITFHGNEQKAESVGKPCHGVEIEIRGTKGEKLAPYEIGKIYVRSDLIFDGYLLNDKIHTIQDQDGWATVDDMGYVDDEGYLFISGREKNMILYGAINIFPEEIEKVISQHPAVEEAAVIGMKDPYWGQIAVAIIKGKTDALELKRLCKNHLASYKIPRKWIFTEEMPYTAGGKIARAQLKDSIERKVISH
ncbi:acyl-CoA synthetase [Cytobacillus firmus]|uniref:AMP-binding protein n=1 Tax=Cytobacillus firmus TaxID=1399 RepID=UPI00077CCFFE|nr:AMP-binding protein [Cytobacillus firmus]MBG9543121.1 acyl-CoA synthetase [Cytobacillus firmus]MBG9552424.1 acyl-CoA synthetase [Cytobacillus firmus]MBG9558915.1 acyl-CoA synthetase [Cytobacillus firmus]MBG9575498.1 acyl-CoA synthetase [Cytobacillus firmus]MEC1892998.1 AMP-binding protein [Cytobacillus firmus]